MKRIQTTLLLTFFLFFIQINLATAAISTFNIDKSFSQGGMADLIATTIDMGTAGSFIVDPGYSGEYFDFRIPSPGTFSTTDFQIAGYYFLKSYSLGDIIDTSNFGSHISSPGIDMDWDTILVNGTPAGAWTASHDGYLGFLTQGSSYGWLKYSFTRSGSTSTISFLNGAFNDVAGAGITAGRTEPVPIPAAIWFFASGIAAIAGLRRKNQA